MVEEQLIAVVYTFSVLTTLGALGWAWRYGEGTDQRLFLFASGAALAWSLAVLGQLVARGETLVRLFQATWVLRWTAVFGWLFFLLEYTNRDWRRPAVVVPAAALLVVAAVANATTHLTGFVYSDLAVASQPTVHVTFQRELGYFLLAVPAFTIIGFVLWELGRLTVRTRRESRRQAAALAAAIVAPGLIAVAQVVGLLPARWVRYAALGNGVQMLCVAYGLFDGRLLRTRPITRSETIEAMADPVVVVDGAGRVVDFNAAARVAFPDLSSGEPLSVAAPTLVESPEAGVPAGLTDRVETTIDGESRRLYVSPNEVDEGTVVVCRDVTATEAYAAELERRTEQLDRFASAVSHDLRNPLTVAQGRVEIASRMSDDAEVTAELESATEAHDRMTRLIEDTLTLAREGAVVDEREQVELATLARRSWGYVDSEGELVVEVPDGYTIEADPGRLQSAFENLYRNAIEHAGPEPTVTVGVTEEGFYIADDGPGVPAAKRQEVFEEGVTTADDGTGFGLAIVESIVTAHGGEVALAESADGGARFEFAGFPGVGGDRSPADVRAQPPAGPESPAPVARGPAPAEVGPVGGESGLGGDRTTPSPDADRRGQPEAEDSREAPGGAGDERERVTDSSRRESTTPDEPFGGVRHAERPAAEPFGSAAVPHSAGRPPLSDRLIGVVDDPEETVSPLMHFRPPRGRPLEWPDGDIADEDACCHAD